MGAQGTGVGVEQKPRKRQNTAATWAQTTQNRTHNQVPTKTIQILIAAKTRHAE